MNVGNLIEKYLQEAKLMQLATVKDNKPWVCSVWFVHDSDLNIYWESRKTRRHSKELLENPHAACVIVKPHTKGRGEKAQGLQFEGEATLVTANMIEKAWKAYKEKYPLYTAPLEELKNINSEFSFYVLKPKRIVLFDEINFPDNPQKEYLI